MNGIKSGMISSGEITYSIVPARIALTALDTRSSLSRPNSNQSRFGMNSNNSFIRDFISRRCRSLMLRVMRPPEVLKVKGCRLQVQETRSQLLSDSWIKLQLRTSDGRSVLDYTSAVHLFDLLIPKTIS